MPVHLLGSRFERIPLLVPRPYVNRFLSLLWDGFEKRIGRVGAQHIHSATDSPEIYEYNVCWSCSDLPFTAEFSFFNHTSNGLLFVLLAVVDRDSKSPSPEYFDKIKGILHQCLKDKIWMRDPEVVGCVRVPVASRFPLSGGYYFELSQVAILPRPGKNEFDLLVPVFSLEQWQLQREVYEVCGGLAAALSVLTQNLLTVDFELPLKFSKGSNLSALAAGMSFDGVYIPDDGHLFPLASGREPSSEDGSIILDLKLCGEIIDAGSCVDRGRLCFPERTDVLLKEIQGSQQLLQSCSRFQDGLLLRAEVMRNWGAVRLGSYELISYVAAIEACLDTRLEKTAVVCEKCGTTTYQEDRRITRKFNDFVAKHGGGSSVISKAFKELYADRSSFVHTGASLHAPLSIGGGGPLVLMGKGFKQNLPWYWYNIHDYAGIVLRNHLYSKLFCGFDASVG